MKKKVLTLLGPALLALVCAPAQAATTTQLSINDGIGDSVTLEWNTTPVIGCPAPPSFCELTTGATTTLAASGASHGTFTFVGTIGTFSFNETTGRGQNVVTLPTLINESSIDATAVGGGTLTTTFTDTAYAGLAAILNLSASNTFTAGTINGSTADFSGFGDAGNAVPATTLIGDLAMFTQTSQPAGQSNAANNNYANPFGDHGSLSEVVTLSFAGAGEIDSGFTIADIAVPEPASVIFLGTMVVGLTGLIRKKTAKRA